MAWYKINTKNKETTYLLNLTKKSVNVDNNKITLNNQFVIYKNPEMQKVALRSANKVNHIWFGEIKSVIETKVNAEFWQPSFEDLIIIFGEEKIDE